MGPNDGFYPLIPPKLPKLAQPFQDPRREIVECFSSLQFVQIPGLSPGLLLGVQIRGLGPDSTSLPGKLGGPGYDMGTQNSHKGEVETLVLKLFCYAFEIHCKGAAICVSVLLLTNNRLNAL